MARILIAEDEPHILRVMSLWLQRHGHETIEACNGRAALDILEVDQVDLIVSDVNMPDVGGLGLAKAVREEHQLDVPMVLVTARCDQADMIEAMKPYRVHLFPKPFVPSSLVALIDRLLAAPAAQGA